ncbi:MAG: hypothetical protein P1V19_25070 [Gimesia sp.]|nr:hypothetical protein [Gimesia sp.]
MQQITADHDGKLSDKWSSYHSVYERVFSEYRDVEVRLLEIGVQNGGSLEIWDKYFSQIQKIVGCDINPLVSQLKYANPCIHLVAGDANQESTAQQILNYSDSFNIIIDDGSHRSDDIIRTFARYFPTLEENGLYVIEDLHCSYWNDYIGGLFEPLSSISFFKRFADIVNYEHWGINKERVALLEKYEHEFGCDFDECELQTIHSIEFANSMCVIRKTNPSTNRLGPRIYAGNDDSIVRCDKENSGKESVAQDQTGNYWSFQGIAIEDELKERLAEIKELLAEIVELKEKNAVFDQQVNALQQKLVVIETSLSWKITKPFRYLYDMVKVKK